MVILKYFSLIRLSTLDLCCAPGGGLSPHEIRRKVSLTSHTHMGHTLRAGDFDRVYSPRITVEKKNTILIAHVSLVRKEWSLSDIPAASPYTIKLNTDIMGT